MAKLARKLTQEEELVAKLSKSGPVVAIGRPAERLPRAGAARMYVDDEQWTHVASQLISICCPIFVRAGSTPGVRWELERLRATADPQKVFIYIPAVITLADDWRDQIEGALGTRLPPGALGDRVIGFDEKWEAEIACGVEYSFWKGTKADPLRGLEDAFTQRAIQPRQRTECEERAIDEFLKATRGPTHAPVVSPWWIGLAAWGVVAASVMLNPARVHVMGESVTVAARCAEVAASGFLGLAVIFPLWLSAPERHRLRAAVFCTMMGVHLLARLLLGVLQ